MKVERRVYRHYKGGSYFVLGTAINEKTKEEVVIYTDVYGGGTNYIRPVKEWFEKVKLEDKEVIRFTPLEKKK